MAAATIFTRFLRELGVPHTTRYSDDEFNDMTFKSLYGLSHLLTLYGVRNVGVRVEDKSELGEMPVPFLAQTRSGVFVIVTGIDKAQDVVTYDSLGVIESVDIESFINAWNGVALMAFPCKGSCEPDCREHCVTALVERLSKWVLALAAVTVAVYFFVTRGVYAHVSTVLIAVFDCVGLYFSYLLLQKSLGIHTASSEHVCGVLEKGGCDSVMQLKVSKLFGVFSWSEVGFGYFGVSLATLLMFPHLWGALALFNVCCLPYTFWSIGYQRFKAHHWCTLCVGVQLTLWALFFCYLGGGWLTRAWPISADGLVLLAVYVFAVLFLNMILRVFKNLPCHENDSRT